MPSNDSPQPLPAPSTITPNAVVSHDRPVGLDRSIPHQPVFNYVQNVRLVGMPEKQDAGVVAACNIEEREAIFSTRAALCRMPGFSVQQVRGTKAYTQTKRDISAAMHCIAAAMKSYEHVAPTDHSFRPFVPRRSVTDILNLLRSESGDQVGCEEHDEHSALARDLSERQAQIDDEALVENEFYQGARSSDLYEQQIQINEEAGFETQSDQRAYKVRPSEQYTEIEDCADDSDGTVFELDSPEEKAMHILRFLDGAVGADDLGLHHFVYSHLTAYLNHSCIPNAFIVTCMPERTSGNGPQHSTVKVIVRALRPIAENEEIMINYNLWEPLPRESRRRFVRQHLGFVCQCDECIHPTNEYYLHEAASGLWGMNKLPRVGEHLVTFFRNVSKLFGGMMDSGLTGYHFLAWSLQLGNVMQGNDKDPSAPSGGQDWIRAYLYRQQSLAWCLTWLGDGHVRTKELQLIIKTLKATRPEVKAFAGKFDWDFLLDHKAWNTMFLLDSPPADRLTGEDCIAALEALRATGAKEKKARANRANRARKKGKKGAAATGTTTLTPPESPQAAATDDAAAPELPATLDQADEGTKSVDTPGQSDTTAHSLAYAADSCPGVDQVGEDAQPVNLRAEPNPSADRLADILDPCIESDKAAESMTPANLPPEGDPLEILAGVAALRIEADKVAESAKPADLPSECDPAADAVTDTSNAPPETYEVPDSTPSVNVSPEADPVAEHPAGPTDSRAGDDEEAESTSSSDGIATPDNSTAQPGAPEIFQGELDAWPNSTLETPELDDVGQPKHPEEAS